MEQNLKNHEIYIGENIRHIRLEQKIGQAELVRLLQLQNVDITHDELIKIENCEQHIKATQLRGIKEALNTTYDELLK